MKGNIISPGILGDESHLSIARLPILIRLTDIPQGYLTSTPMNLAN